MHGLVIRNTGSWYTVAADDGTVWDAKVKGNFRIKGIRSTNPVAIGDKVEFNPMPDHTALITAIDDRTNYVIRKSTNLSKQSHINADDRQLLQGMVDLYETVGYQCRCVSALTGEGMDEIHQMLKGKTTLLSGNSGVGKSTLINALFPDLNLRTSEVSDAYNTGKHTTTFSEMYPIEDGGYIIDTPGIKGFGTFDIEREEVGHYFKEIFRFSSQCRFNNCTHTHEPGCAVLEAVERRDISLSRYNSYLSMLDDKEEDKYRKGY